MWQHGLHKFVQNLMTHVIPPWYDGIPQTETRQRVMTKTGVYQGRDKTKMCPDQYKSFSMFEASLSMSDDYIQWYHCSRGVDGSCSRFQSSLSETESTLSNNVVHCELRPLRRPTSSTTTVQHMSIILTLALKCYSVSSTPAPLLCYHCTAAVFTCLGGVWDSPRCCL